MLKKEKRYAKKAQAAMEFLTTYGWAILILLIVIVTLANVGVFSAPSTPSSCSVGAPFVCSDIIVTTALSDSGVFTSNLTVKANNVGLLGVSSYRSIKGSCTNAIIVGSLNVDGDNTIGLVCGQSNKGETEIGEIDLVYSIIGINSPHTTTLKFKANREQGINIVDNNPPTVSVSHSPPGNPTDAQTVTFTATATDASGISQIQIFVDDLVTPKTTCASSPCTFIGGPYTSGSTHNYYATALDGAPTPNTGRDPLVGTKSFTVTAAAAGPIIAYNLNEGSGTTANDASGNGYNGGISGTTWTSSGIYGNALSYTGNGQYVNIPYVNLGNSITYSMWFRRLGDGFNPCGVDAPLLLYANTLTRVSSTQIRWWPNIAGGGRDISWTGDTNWHYLSITQSGTTCNVYLDGSSVYSSGTCPALNIANVAQTLGNSQGCAWNGIIDEVRIYDRALSQAEVQSDMNAPIQSPLRAILNTLQHATTTLASGSASTVITVSSVDMSKSILFYSVNVNSNAPNSGKIIARLTSPTQITISRPTAAAVSADITWYLAEFSSGVSVQRGLAALGGTVNINPVTTLRSFLLHNGDSGGTIYNDDDFIRGRITSSTTINFDAMSAISGNVEWQVVELLDSSNTVQSGIVLMPSTSTQLVQPIITSVDLTKSFILFSFKQSTAATLDGMSRVESHFQDASNIIFSRTNSGIGLDISYFVVSFADPLVNVESKTATLLSAGTQKDVTLTSNFDLMKSVPVISGWMRTGKATGSSNIVTPGWYTADLTANTNLRLTRAGSGVQGDVSCSVIQFTKV